MITALEMTGELWWHYPEEIPLFHRLAAECDTIVNIGVGFGTSCLALHEGNPKATIFGVDLRPCEEAAQRWQEANVPPGRILRILGDSQTIVWPWMVDLVLIDGDHDRQSVINDYIAWRPKARKWVVFHDYKNPICNQVAPAVDDLMKRPPDEIAGYLAAYRVP